MTKVVAIVALCSFGLVGLASAATNTPPSPTRAFNYSCDEEAGICTCELDTDANDCRDMLDSHMCRAPEDIVTPWTSEGDARGNGFEWFDYVDCDRATGRCTCNLVAGRETPELGDRRPQAQLQVLEGDRPNEVVPARRGTAPAISDVASQDNVSRRRRMDDINDGTSNTLIVTEMEMMGTEEEDAFADGSVHNVNGVDEAVMMNSGDEEEEMPVGAIHSEEAPPEVLGMNPGRDRVVDHRDPLARGNVTDHRGNRTDHREEGTGDRPNEVVPARRGTPSGGNRPDTATDPSENAPFPVGLNMPSNLDTSDVSARTVMLHWMDNSTREWGVELHRMDPVAARRDGVVNWEFIGNFEERRDSNVTGTGMRSDQDFDLTPETNYCYRLRAYVGFDKSELSDFSGITCVFTSQ